MSFVANILIFTFVPTKKMEPYSICRAAELLVEDAFFRYYVSKLREMGMVAAQHQSCRCLETLQASYFSK